MSGTKFLGKVSLRALVLQKDQVLITRDAQDATVWELPGGRLHEDESLEDGLKRELREELGVEVALGQMAYSEQFRQTRDGTLHLLLTYTATIQPSDQTIRCDQTEIAEARWIKKEELAHYELYDNCLRALKSYWQLV